MRSTPSSTSKVQPPQPRALSSLRRRRLALGLPMWQIGRAVGRDTPVISRLERGEIQNPALEEQIAAVLTGLERAQKKKSARA